MPKAEFMELDEVRATALCVERSDEVPPGGVVAALTAAADAASAVGAAAGASSSAVRAEERGTAAAAGQAGSEAREKAKEGSGVAALDGRQRWRRRLHHYLDWLLRRDPPAATPFAALQASHVACLDEVWSQRGAACCRLARAAP
jgi:hypothetical protein